MIVEKSAFRQVNLPTPVGCEQLRQRTIEDQTRRLPALGRRARNFVQLFARATADICFTHDVV